MPGARARGPRGLTAPEIVAAAVAVREELGAEGFSVRKVATRVGCDPMAVLYHFKTRDGLERAMADHLNERLILPDPATPWRARLHDLAWQYRALALAYPQTFPLLFRFWVTGPADYRSAELVYQALTDAGLSDADVTDACCGWYASILGLAAGEAGGLLRPGDAAELEEVRSLPPAEFPRTTALVEKLAEQRPGGAYERMLDIILDGVAARAQPIVAPKSRPSP